MVSGSCLCGGIQFEADSIPLMVNCHCSMCRKFHGAAFGSFAFVPFDEFRLLKGQDLIQLYETSPGSYRGFCRVCGSTVPLLPSHPEEVCIPAGLLDDDPGVRPALHLFVGSKAPWWEITDDLPQFEELAPGYGPDDPK